MRRGTRVIILAALALLTACGGPPLKPEAQSRHLPRLPERTGELAAYDLLDALLSTPVSVAMPPGYTAPARFDGGYTAAKFNPRTSAPGSPALGGVVHWPTGPNALDQFGFHVAATAGDAATAFALPPTTFGPLTETFTPAEFSVPALCRVFAATGAGSGGLTTCSVLVDNVIIFGTTRGRTDPSRGNDDDAVALVRAGMAQLQAVQAEQARIAATAPTTRVVRVGLLTSYWSREYRGLLVQRLGELGWVRGRNLVMEYRFFADQPERLPELAAELVRERVDVIVTDDTPAARAAKAATATIPVIFRLFEDPVAAGLVASHARPGANLTGIVYSEDPFTAAKRLDLLAEAVPSIRRVGVLVESPSGPVWRELEQVARERDLELLPLAVRNRGELAGVLAGGAAAGAQALLMTDLLPYQGGDFQDYLIAATRFAQQQRLPLFVNGASPFQLLSYAASLTDLLTITAAHVDRVLRGATPAQLPVEQVKEFELSVNLALAQNLGLTIAPSVLARADEIIDPGAARPRRVR